MRINRIHPWENLTIEQAQKLQTQLAQKIEVAGDVENIRVVAGADMAFSRADDLAFGVVVAFSFPGFEVLELQRGVAKISFPYVPGFLSFREAPLLLQLFEKLLTEPDIVLVDGQGIAHPRRLGLAAHLGLFLPVPTIGVAKSKLVGQYTEPGPNKGDWSWLYHNGEKVGVVLRTRDRVKPIFVSPGNRIGFDAARRIALACSTKYRIPEPTRIADKLVAQFKKSYLERHKS